MVHWLKSRGAPKTALKLDYQGLRMRSSMINTYNHFAIKDLIVVTQSFDLARSLYLTEKIGISIAGYVADKRIYRNFILNRIRESLARSVALYKSWNHSIK